MSTNGPDHPPVELHGVCKRFRSDTALHHLSLQIPRGSSFGLIGPNGAGKTTTIRLLMGQLRPTQGRVAVLGHDPLVDPLEVRRRVGYVPEVHTVHRWMQVGEAIAFCRHFYPSWNEERCAELLDLFQLPRARKVKHLSKGTLAKLSLLLALAHEPELLILDEPMGGLDPVAREEFLDGVIQSLCEHNRTMLFCSHMLSDVQRMVNRVGILHSGRLLIDRPVDDLLDGTKRIRAVLRDGSDLPPAPASAIWQRRQNREWLLTVSDYRPQMLASLRESSAVEDVEVQDVTLEDIFKDYIRGQRSSS